MEHGARLSTSRVMAIAFIFMSVLIVLSLSVNVIQGVNTCMTMEQANEKAKKLEQSSEAKPVAASLPRLAEGNFRTMPVQTVTATTPSGSRPAVTAHPEQKLLAPRPLFTAAREVKTVVPVSSVAPVTPPRPLRTGEQTAALWIAPYIDNQDVYHQPSSVFFVIKPSAWGKPRIN
ncbi:TPA: type IV conjugative transfer system lipoprotein TraV [Escherichia coli]